MKKGLYFILLIACMSCVPDDEVYFGDQEVEGLRPIYGDPDEVFAIALLEPQPIVSAGKLYLYGDLLLINEIGKGIHLIDNANPADPVKLGFVQVPGSYDMVVKGDIIYANNQTDLVALKITSNSVEVTERIANVMGSNGMYPQERGVYFECIDPTKGVVVAWKKEMLTNPKCFR